MHPLDADHLLRPVRAGDGAELARAYADNRAHLAPWEPVREDDFFTDAWQERHVRQSLADAADGRAARFVIVASDGRIVGRVNLNNIVRGAFRSADLGYWVAADRLRHGLASRGVALVAELARVDLGLHRLQAATLLHNVASQRVLQSTGFTPIGTAPRYLRIAGEWQDHLLFQLLLEQPLSAPRARP